MPYRISYKAHGSSRRMVHGGRKPATFRTKKSAQKYKRRFEGLFKGRKAKIYHVKTHAKLRR